MLEDFEEGGKLFGVYIPDYLPIPKEIMEFIFGDPDWKPTYSEQLKLLTLLQAIKGWDVEYCDCGAHMVKRKKIENENKDHNLPIPHLL